VIKNGSFAQASPPIKNNRPTHLKQQRTSINYMSISFLDKLQARIDAVDSLLCVGLDPHSSELNLSIRTNPNDAAFTFCHNLILATSHVAACYKPNAAFFEALGDDGIKTLRRVCDTIPHDIPILLDVKRGDIGTTAQAYASACYDHIKADAVTLSPLMGMDSMEPFVTGTCVAGCLVETHTATPTDRRLLAHEPKRLDFSLRPLGAYSHKAAFVLCKTSNPGSNDLLTLPLQQQGGSLLYEEIARFVAAQKLPFARGT
jgi:uridine monophosphate synthetase